MSDASKSSPAEALLFPAFSSVFVPFVCRYAWGAISSATIGRLLNSIELTVPRIEGVLRHWEALDTLKYVIDAQPISLTEFILSCFKGQLAMWVDQPTRNIRTDLQSAADQMRQASKEEIQLRLIDRLCEMADTERNLEHREWLKTPGVIEAGLEAECRKGQDQYDNLTSGDTGELWGFLYQLDKTYSESLH